MYRQAATRLPLLLRQPLAFIRCSGISTDLTEAMVDSSFMLASKNKIPPFFRHVVWYSTSSSSSQGHEIPPELLKTNGVLTPDRPLGLYADLVTRVTNFQNEDKGLMVLAGDVFDVPIRKDIVQRVVRWQLAKRQQGTHCTKTISEVSGSGRKPWKQKGTGRARHGTLRGPQFRHGATMHGPKPRSHAIKLQKKVRRLGLKIALSARTAEGKVQMASPLVTHAVCDAMVQQLSQISPEPSTSGSDTPDTAVLATSSGQAYKEED